MKKIGNRKVCISLLIILFTMKGCGVMSDTISSEIKDIAEEIFDRFKEYNFESKYIAKQFSNIPDRLLTKQRKKEIISSLYQLMKALSGYDIIIMKDKYSDNIAEYTNSKIKDMISNGYSVNTVNRYILYADIINCILTIESVLLNNETKSDIILAFNNLHMLDDPQNYNMNINKTKTDSSSAMLETTFWKVYTDNIDIPATPINTTISPDEVKDISALYNV